MTPPSGRLFLYLFYGGSSAGKGRHVGSYNGMMKLKI